MSVPNDAQNITSALLHRAYLYARLTPEALKVVGLADTDYAKKFDAFIKKETEHFPFWGISKEPDDPATPLEEAHQRECAPYIVDSEDDEAVLNPYLTWYRRLYYRLWYSEEKRLDKKKAYVKNYIEQFGETTDGFNKAYIQAESSKRKNLIQRTIARLAAIKKKQDRNFWLHLVGLSIAIIISIAQGMLFSYFAASMFGVGVLPSLLIGIAGIGANIAINVESVPTTLREFINWTFYKNINKKINVDETKQTSTFKLRRKYVYMGLALIPALASGLAYGFSIYASILIGPHAAIHWHWIAGIAALTSPHVFALVIASLATVTIAMLFYRVMLNLIKQDAWRSMKRFLTNFWTPKVALKGAALTRYRATNVLSSILIVLALVVMSLGAYSGMSGLFTGTQLISSIPLGVNIAMSWVLAGIARIPLLTSVAVMMFSRIGSTFVDIYFNLKTARGREAFLDRIGAGFEYVLTERPVVYFGLLGALIYVPVVFGRRCSRKGLGFAFKRFVEECGEAVNATFYEPWLVFGIVGGVISSFFNAIGNIMFAAPGTPVPDRFCAGTSATVITSSFYVVKENQMTSDFWALNAPIVDADSDAEATYRTFFPRSKTVLEVLEEEKSEGKRPLVRQPSS
ncbi:MAG: hypothetical protein DHS20C10_01090 [marine bacterium B5-7]|nr:MAG: hypothetical protein DHS20C10_01090 [marine bacterium B5-7]